MSQAGLPLLWIVLGAVVITAMIVGIVLSQRRAGGKPTPMADNSDSSVPASPTDPASQVSDKSSVPDLSPKLTANPEAGSGGSTTPANAGGAVQGRIKQAAEAIRGDAGLTDEMDDAPATRLLDWAEGISRQIAEQTGQMPDSQAQEFLDARMQELRKVVRRINKLIGSLSDAAADEVAESLQNILDAALALAAQTPALQPQPPTDLNSAAEKVSALNASDAVGQILSYLNKGEQHGEEAQQQ